MPNGFEIDSSIISNQKYLKFPLTPAYRQAGFPSPQRGEGGGEGVKMLEENSQIQNVRIYASSGTSPGRGGPFG
ncbi:MAG: hypothetical protein AB1502_07875, partial [Thermodesulfobacteriota bacterium]